MNNSACPEVLEEIAALPAMSLARLAVARDAGEYSRFAAELSPEALRHLPECDFCREEIALLADASATLNALRAPALPPDFAARVQNAIADIPQDAIVSPDVSAAPQTPREYSQALLESSPEDVPSMIAPPLPQATRGSWRARFGLEKIGGAPRRNLKVAWASGSVLAAFVLVLATQIEPPSMLAPRNNSSISEKAANDSPPPIASTREKASEKSGVQKGAAQKTSGTPAKPNATPTKNAAPRIGAAPKSAPSPNAPFGGSELVAPPTMKSSDNSAPRVGLAPPLLPLRRTSPKPKSASENATPRAAVRKTLPSTEVARKAAPVAQPRVLAQSSAAARDSQMKSEAPQASRERAPISPAPVDTAPPRADNTRSGAQREDFAPSAAISGGAKPSEAAAPSVASTRDSARNTQRMRATASEKRAAAPDETTPTESARSGDFADPVPAARNRTAQTPISLRVELVAPRDIERARLRLELPHGAKLQAAISDNVIWSGALKRGESAVADVKIIADETLSPTRARAVLESRERKGWRVIATKNIEWKAP